jgi:hypothetical protein
VPFTRPAEISNGVSLSEKEAGFVMGLVSENGAVDSLLSGIVDEFFPNKQGVSGPSSQDNFLTGAAKQFWFSSVFVKLAAVVAVEKFPAHIVPVFSDPPERLMHQ